jgi:hypothetical protein
MKIAIEGYGDGCREFKIMRLWFFKSRYGKLTDRLFAWWFESKYSQVQIEFADGRIFGVDLVDCKFVDMTALEDDADERWDCIDLAVNESDTEAFCASQVNRGLAWREWLLFPSWRARNLSAQVISEALVHAGIKLQTSRNVEELYLWAYRIADIFRPYYCSWRRCDDDVISW